MTSESLKDDTFAFCMELPRANGEPLVVIVTPTVGTKHLVRCVKSVQNQTYANLVQHWIVVDGIAFLPRVTSILDSVGKNLPNVRMCVIPSNTGHGQWNGHRVYAAFSYLINAPYVTWLDEDNTFLPNHIETCVKTIKELPHPAWVYAWRSLYMDEDTTPLQDKCESMGGIRHTFLNKDDYLADTSCMFLSTSLAMRFAPCWLHKRVADRNLTKALLKANDVFHAPTRQCTVCYRSDGGPFSVRLDTIQKHNDAPPFLQYKPAYRDVYCLRPNELPPTRTDVEFIPFDRVPERVNLLWDQNVEYVPYRSWWTYASEGESASSSASLTFSINDPDS